MAPDRSTTSKGKETKTRSRAGCLTCRQRHKKCDETKLEENNGACKRCFSGSWECRWPLPPGERPLKSFRSTSKRSKGKEREEGSRATSAGDSEEEDDQLDPSGGAKRGSTYSEGQQQGYDPTQQNSYPSTSYPPIASTSLATYSLPYPAMTSSHYSQPIPPPSAQPPVLPLPSAPGVPSAQPNEDLNEFFASLDAELGYWQNLGQDSMQSGVSAEFTTLPMPGDPDEDMTMPVPRVSPRSQPYEPEPTPNEDVNGIEEPVSARQQPVKVPPPPQPPSQSAAQPTTISPSAQIPPLPRPEEPSNAQPPQASQAPSPPSSHPDEPDIVDPIYSTFNAEFFRSLPKPVRDIVVKGLYGVANSHELTRNAGMAMVMIYRSRQNPDSAASTEVQQRLLAQSDVYFQRAMEHLQKPIPFEAKLVAALDMQAYQFDQFGAAASNAILLLGEFFINEALGSQPALDLSSIQNSLDVLFATFAWTDCIRCICIPKRRTVFAFSNLPGEPSATSPSSVLADVNTSEKHSIETHLGLPVGLLLCIAATANLSSEMEALPDEVVKFKGEAIEKAIRNWRPNPFDPSQANDGAAWIEKLATAEMWRYACILFLYQAVFRHGSLSLVVRSALQQILQIGARVLNNHPIQSSSLSPPPHSTVDPSSQSASTGQGPSSSSTRPIDSSHDDYVSACSTRAVPWFLAATVSVLPGDRELCRRGLSICGKQKGYQDNLQAVERIWQVVDEQGWTVDWRALLQNEKRFVGFL